MSTLFHDGSPVATIRQEWRTKAHGSDDDEYQIYLSCADDGAGIDITTGLPLKTFDEWLNS